MKKAHLYIILFFVGFVGYSQSKHTVVKGETLYSISKKYNIKTDDIIKLNPDAKDGVKENTVLTLPNGVKAVATKTTLNKYDYEVQQGETLYAISKKLGVSVDEMIKNNPASKEGVVAGQSLTYFASKKYFSTTTQVVKNDVVVKKEIANLHTIQAEETKYSVSKKYGISIPELEELNPHIKNVFEIGMQIRLNKNTALPKIAATEFQPVATTKTMFYAVQQGETLFSISRKFGISVDEITKKNPAVSTGLTVGMELILPEKKEINSTIQSEDADGLKKKLNLLGTANKTKQRNLVLLMPFNINRIEKDSSKTKLEYLKTDKFLNITLDFYAGALKAIDSAKVLGLPINAKVYDAETSKYSSNVATIIKNNNFSNVDVVIGPFTNSFVETAGLLLDKNTAIISPLTNDGGKGGSNVFYAMPNETIQKVKLMSYLKSKSDAIFAIHSSAKTSLSTYFASNYPEVKSSSFNDKGLFDYTIFKTNLQKGKKNFVILDSDKIMQVISVVNNLIKLKKEFDIQLVVVERNDALDFEEIPSKNLAALQMLYPSAIRENESIEAMNFAKSFKKDNKIQPNQYATRGFDVTFDAILRMCQEDGFIKSTESQVSEQIESQFNYANNNNWGVYMMYYNSDLTIKQAQ
ncbi:LysM peptidoglycan-binding domain-containing protein [Flavobacterium terrigena]|uniref:LysM domain-containing protein n=1 Tax=Flavobacterium terrigena TaxID=402734 RepID=A0A1H6UJF7_9FLAO|nr:LysM peptidoglycan-binding domain-containing protein [Flavobacterium terrigena]SEI92419.1 LysM domain-containing protein [Flavobacterium terrigena]